MRNFLFSAIALLAIALPARAQNINATPVSTVLQVGMACAPVSISSYSATSVPVQVLGSTSTTTAYSIVRIHDLDASGNIYANEQPTVSTTTTAGIMGEPVQNSGTTVNVRDWLLKPGQLWYATCDKTTGPCSAIVCKGR
jgi:hypothetical protein